MSKGNQVGLGPRLLVIIFGLAIVAIGAYPIQERYGSILEFITHDSVAFAGQFVRDSRRKARSYGIARNSESLSVPPVKKVVPAGREHQGDRAKIKMDRLTKKDRKALDNLIQGLD